MGTGKSACATVKKPEHSTDWTGDRDVRMFVGRIHTSQCLRHPTKYQRQPAADSGAGSLIFEVCTFIQPRPHETAINEGSNLNKQIVWVYRQLLGKPRCNSGLFLVTSSGAGPQGPLQLGGACTDMATKLFVGNLPHSTTDTSLGELVTSVGFEVASAFVARDRTTGTPRGFGFVELGNGEDVQRAVARLNGHSLEGRPLTVRARF